MLRKLFAFILVISFVVTEVSSQTIGVVMSGGGAKGLYHVGVLEALEENGIPIDYIAGTSMGAIVAGLYAAGYSPKEMREIVNSGIVKEWISGRIDSKYLPYYREVSRQPSFFNVGLDFNVDDGAKLFIPTNIISSTQIDMALMDMFAPATAACGGDFNKLMVPFLCAASDITKRDLDILTSGSLEKAIRASMSLPLIFKPVKIGKSILYDGGIYDNFPWKPLDERFKPGYIIGVKCTEGNTPPNVNDNLFDQAFSIAMQITDYNLPKGRSIMIDRAVKVSMLDFNNANAIMDLGYEDTMAKMDDILASVDRRWTQEEYVTRREKFRKASPPLIFDNYKFEGVNRDQKEYIRDFIDVDDRKTDSERVMDYTELRNDIYSLISDDDFSMEFPDAIYNPDKNKYTFNAKLLSKPNFKVSIGGNLSSTAFNQIYLGINYRVVKRVAHSVGADIFLGPLYTWLAMGGRIDFHVGKPVFFDYSYNYTVRNLRHGAFGNISDINNTLQTKNSDSYLSIGAGMPISARGLLTLKTNIGHKNYYYDSNGLFANIKDHTRFSYFATKAEVERNTLDKQLFPRTGSRLRLSTIYVVGRDKYSPFDENKFISKINREWVGARFTADKYFNIGWCSWFSLGLNLDAVLTNKGEFSTDLSSLMSMPSYAPVQHSKMIYMPDFSANRFIAGGMMPTFNIIPNLFLRTGVYTMWRDSRSYAYRDNGRGRVPDRSVHFMAEASVVYHTPVGPVSLAFTKYDFNSNDNMYLTFNFGYTIFAPRGIFY